MKYPMIIMTAFLVSQATKNLSAQTIHQKTQNVKTMETASSINSKEVVQQFFNAFGTGDFNRLITLFHDSAVTIGIRDAQRTQGEIYGTYHGKEGVKNFIANMGMTFDTKSFTVENIIGEGDIAFANGNFTHIIRATGKPFTSAWALKCVIKDGQIYEYHFYEDSEKFAEASKN